jgi:signal transduction histidine kinase
MRPWLVWTLFALCLAVVLAAMGWVTVAVLRLDASEAAARQHAEVEENVRLALWRMDSTLAPLIAREGSWPYFAYSPFYPAQRAYTNMLQPVRQGEVLVPSPLLRQASPFVLLHFQVGPGAAFSSPQVPTGRVLRLAESGYTSPEAIARASRRLQQLQPALADGLLARRLEPPLAASTQVAVLPPEPPNQAPANSPRPRPQKTAAQSEDFDLQQRVARQQQQIAMQQAAAPQPQPADLPPDQQGKNTNEWSARNWSIANNGLIQAFPRDPESVSDVHEGVARPVWLGDSLVLARRVLVNRDEVVQGCWLDWPALCDKLLSDIRDLLPSASLLPLRAVEQADGRVLAALPVRLEPGPLASSRNGRSSPLRLSLVAAWACAILAAAAVAVLLAGAMSLSERRGAFVSAVTHEMRTPLTTFRMYTEMLVKGMVPEARRSRYLDTLRTEADRLAHLVENVLAYARLERSAPAARNEPTPPTAIVDRVRARLTERAEQAGMSLRIELPCDLQGTIDADPVAIEQILFNLVDNACKYASEASDRTIHLRVSADERNVSFAVRDHGPGIPDDQRRRLFRPFSKSARDAAYSAPGVGLGLALSRRLARRMGADLRWSPDGQGATFVLSLPRGNGSRQTPAGPGDQGGA